MKVIYVAGPFRAENHWEQEQNIRRAEQLALCVWQIGGVACICPHTNTRYYQGACPDDVWLEGDLEILSRCDALLLAPRWRDSVGTLAEKAYAESLDIPVFDDFEELEKWLKK